MKVVHINKVLIKKESETSDMVRILRAKWEARGRKRAEKRFAALKNNTAK